MSTYNTEVRELNNDQEEIEDFVLNLLEIKKSKGDLTKLDINEKKEIKTIVENMINGLKINIDKI
jgi:hypothetical protein